MNRTAIWSILFALGLILILMQYEISRYIADSTAKKMGCRQPLDARPYQDSVSAEHR